MKNYLHLAHDNPLQDYFFKFLCEDRKDENHEILIFCEFEKTKFVKYTNKKIKIITSNPDKFLLNIKTSNYSIVFFHLLDVHFSKFIINNVNKVKFAWVFWGHDGYRLNLLPNIYGSLTKKLIDSINTRSIDSSKQIIKTNIKGYLNKINLLRFYNFYSKSNYFISNNDFIIRSLFNVDFCLTSMEYEYLLIRNSFKLPKLRWKNFFYLPLLKINDIKKENNVGNILIGNSANPTNNHLEIFKLLYPLKDKITSMLCPLSYSGTSLYIDKIKKEGYRMFLNKIRFQLEFIQLNEWELQLANIEFVIFNHIRQQGFGNIKYFLASGKKVYLNSKSTIYKSLKKMGCIVFATDIDDIQLIPLTIQEKELNQEVILSYYNIKAFINNWEEIINEDK